MCITTKAMKVVKAIPICHTIIILKNTTVEAILKFILKIDTPNTYTYPLTFLAWSM